MSPSAALPPTPSTNLTQGTGERIADIGMGVAAIREGQPGIGQEDGRGERE